MSNLITTTTATIPITCSSVNADLQEALAITVSNFTAVTGHESNYIGNPQIIMAKLESCGSPPAVDKRFRSDEQYGIILDLCKDCNRVPHGCESMEDGALGLQWPDGHGSACR